MAKKSQLFGPLRGKQEISKELYSFFVWSMKSVERVSQSISVNSKETSKTVNEFDLCLLIGQIGNSFFGGKKCSVSHLFFLVFKRKLLIVLLQVRKMNIKATMRQISFGQKNRERQKVAIWLSK